MRTVVFLEQLYSAVPEWLVVLALGAAFLSLLARLSGLRRGYLVSRPRALWGLIATTGGLTMFYASLLIPGAPESAEARGGVVRVLLILLGVAFCHWNYEYVKLVVRHSIVAGRKRYEYAKLTLQRWRARS